MKIKDMYPYARSLSEVKCEIIFDANQNRIDDWIIDRTPVDFMIEELSKRYYISEAMDRYLHDAIVSYAQH